MNLNPTRATALDLETYQIEDGLLTPPLVCGSFATMRGGAVVGELTDRARTLSRARQVLVGDDVIYVANGAFDFGVLANEDHSLLDLIFAAYAAGRVHDLQVAQALHAIYEGNLYLDPRTGREIVSKKTGKRGRYSLDLCTALVLGREDAKDRDAWQRRYAVLADVPIEEWPPDARQYPVDDAVNTFETAHAQRHGGGAGVTPGPHHNLGDLPDQCETAWGLHLGAIWGLRTDRGRIADLRARVEVAHRDFVEKFREAGFFRADGKKDTSAVKRAVVVAYCSGGTCPSPDCVGGKILSPISGNPVNCKVCSGTGLDIAGAPRTPTGGVKADRDALVESGDSELAAFGESEAEKVRETYLPFLETGVDRPIALRPNILVASGRTSYDGLIQVLPHATDAKNLASLVRPCFRARDGYVYCSVDYAALELCTLAQVCLWVLGRSNMAETINATGSPGSLHTAFAGAMMGVGIDEMAALIRAKDPNAKKYRQAAKCANFGFPGGMGAAKFVFSKRKRSEGSTEAPDGKIYEGIRFCLLLGGAERCGVEKVHEWKGRATPSICRACAEVVEDYLRPEWFRQWTEIRAYFSWVTGRTEAGATMPCLGTHRERGGCGFTDGANNGFQALAADGAKLALRRLVRECYTDRSSVLYGSRPVSFVHDEIVAELPEETAHLAGPRMAEVMVAGMRELVPDVTVEAKPALMRWWYKEAEAVYEDGRLVPWEPN